MSFATIKQISSELIKQKEGEKEAYLNLLVYAIAESICCAVNNTFK